MARQLAARAGSTAHDDPEPRRSDASDLRRAGAGAFTGVRQFSTRIEPDADHIGRSNGLPASPNSGKVAEI
jgi:hypothetical protein